MTQHNQVNGVLCQSCGAGLRHAADFGTDAEGTRVAEYCRRCFRDGRFTEPDLTFEELVDRTGHRVPGGDGPFPATERPHVHVLQALDRWRSQDAPREKAQEPAPRGRARKSMR